MSQVIIAGDTSGTITLQAPAVSGSTTLTLPAVTGTVLQSGTVVTEAQGGNGTTTGYYGFKNRIINGAMVIDQRNAGASGTANAYMVDRWQYFGSQASKLTWQQNAGSVTPPAGFSNYLGFTSSSAYTVGAGEIFAIYQPVEGFNFADMSWGTANAKTVTLSFWVRSSLTGTFGGVIQNNGGSRSYPISYTISSANTWEQKSITVAGDTSGTWVGATNGVGVYVQFALGVGSTYSGTAGAWASANYVSATGATSVVGTNGATFYITGVQLEKGSTATSFDYRPFGTELALCQRYFVLTNTSNTAKNGGAWGSVYTSGAGHITGALPVPLRTAGTVTFGGTSNTFYMSNVNATSAGTPVNTSATALIVDFEINGMSASSVGVPIQYNGQMSITAEL